MPTAGMRLLIGSDEQAVLAPQTGAVYCGEVETLDMCRHVLAFPTAVGGAEPTPGRQMFVAVPLCIEDISPKFCVGNPVASNTNGVNF